MRILVVGPGAIGVLLATRLACRTWDVTAAARPESAAQLPHVWSATNLDGRPMAARIPVLSEPDEAQAPFGMMILATKCQDAEDALRTWLPMLKPGAPAVAIQNGLMGDVLASHAGDRLVEATVAFPASLVEPGHSRQTGPGSIILGAWPDARMDAATPLQQAVDVLREASPLRIHRNMLGVKWTKLLINSAITGLGVLTGTRLGPMLDEPRARKAFVGIVTEGHQAGLAAGVHFEKVAGFHPSMAALPARASSLARARADLVVRIAGRKYRKQESSSLQGLRRGRPTEIPYLNGRVAAEARRHGLQAPLNEAVVELAQDIERGEFAPAPDNLLRLPVP